MEDKQQQQQQLPSLLDKLRFHASATPTRPLFAYVNDAGDPIASVTYAALDAATAALATRLLTISSSSTAKAATRGARAVARPLLKPGDRVVLVFLPSLDFI